MKKILIFILLAMTAQAQVDIILDLKNLWKDILGENIANLLEMNSGLNKAVSMCYVPEKSKSSANLDICVRMKQPVDLSIDVCKSAPDIPGFKKKKNVLSLNADKYMIDFCSKNILERAQSAIADMDIFSKENNFNFENPDNQNNSNKAEEDAGKFFAAGGSPKEIMKNSESISRQALYSGNQKVMREVVNYAKNSNRSMSNITSKNLSAPSNYTAYLLDRKNLVKAATSDHYEQSPLAVSSAIRQKVSSIKDSTEALDEAEQMSANATDKVDFGTNKRIQLYLDVLAKDDDYAIPTQEMVALLREDLRPDAIAKIKQQIKREAIIISELTQIDKARKDLLTIAGNKAVVISRQFDAKKAEEEIDELIDTGSGY
jgi:hypothetical protein